MYHIKFKIKKSEKNMYVSMNDLFILILNRDIKIIYSINEKKYILNQVCNFI